MKHERSSVRLKSHIPLRAVLGAIICASFSLASASASDVGVVVDYSPAGATLYLSRAGVQSPVIIEIATVVQAGDEIQLLANSTVTIELADNRRITSSGPGTWSVPSAPALGSIAEFFHRIEFIVDPNYSRTATAITRGPGRCTSEDAPPIAAPILPARAQVKAGMRGVSVAWTGGCAPYHLALNSKQSALQKAALPSRNSDSSTYPSRRVATPLLLPTRVARVQRFHLWHAARVRRHPAR
jgi:hypothetical protein